MMEQELTIEEIKLAGFNQFSPSEKEIELIKQKNKLLPQTERICYKCGHKACPHCLDWCDSVLHTKTEQGNWLGITLEEVKEEDYSPFPCCEQSCSYV